MKERPCSEEQFLKNVKDHKAIIIRDDDERAYRHIRFRQPKDSNMYFDLITWPGHLCFTGDMGTYVFERVEDMFGFFRNNHTKDKNIGLSINPDYWGEKLLCSDKVSGFQKFSPERFKERARDHLERCEYDEILQERIWKEVEESVLCYLDGDFDQENRAYRKIQDFVSEEEPSFIFLDFFDGGGTNEYTYRYIWCLYAIVWGISKYDEVRAEKENTTAVAP